MNHAILMAAVTQIRHPHSPGCAFYDRKIAGGQDPEGSPARLKRRVSDALYATMVADARRFAANIEEAREGNRGTT